MNREIRIERARWLAGTGLVVPIPFLFAVGANPLIVGAGLATIGLVALLLARGRLFVLPDFALNLIGIAFLFVLFGERRLVAPSLTGLSIHLLLFLFVVRLLSLRGRREVWTAYLLLVLLAMAGAATAVDITIVIWLLSVAFVLLHMLSRFVHLEELEAVGKRTRGEDGPVPPFRLTAALLGGSILLAIPIFVFLPRMRQPFVRGFSTDARSEGAFSDQLDMASIGRLKNGRSVVFRATWPARSSLSGEGQKFRVGTYEIYDAGTWIAAGTAAKGAPGSWVATGLVGEPLLFEPRAVPEDGRFEPIDIDLARTGGRSLPVPYRLVAFENPSALSAVWRDRAGIVQTRFPPNRPMTYRVWTSRGENPESLPPPGRKNLELGLPGSGLDRVRVLAASLDSAGGDVATLGGAFERHLAGSLGYTLVVESPPQGVDPIEHFVSSSRRGHCELFASAMALMLRSRGVPARVVVGFAGGETSLFGGEVVYRQRHAHAWVEAWDEAAGGWLVFDPTPSEGRPTIEKPSIAGRIRSLWERAQFGWDRFVLGFDFGDQFGLFRQARFLVRNLSRRIETSGGDGLERIWKALSARARELTPGQVAISLGVVGAFLVLRRVALRFLADFREPPGRLALTRAITRLVEAGRLPADVSSSTGREVARKVGRALEGPFLRIVEAHEREAFGGIPLDGEERHRLREALREVGSATAARSRT